MNPFGPPFLSRHDPNLAAAAVAGNRLGAVSGLFGSVA